MSNHKYSKSESSNLLDFQADITDVIGLNDQIVRYDLSEYLEKTVTLRNILWEFDILPFKEDLIHYFGLKFDLKTDQKILAIKKAKYYDNWFYSMLNVYLKNQLNHKFFNIKNLCDIIHVKSPLICKRIIQFQSDILNEFSSKKVLIGLLIHQNIRQKSSSLISNLKSLIEEPLNNFELHEISFENFDFDRELLKYKAIFVILDENLARCFDEDILLENLEITDQIYRKIGRKMYQEYIEFGKNLKFFTLIMDKLNVNYLNEKKNFFKYHWLLKDLNSFECTEDIDVHLKEIKKIYNSFDLQTHFYKNDHKKPDFILKIIKNMI